MTHPKRKLSELLCGLDVRVRKQGRWFVSEAVGLDVVSQGTTERVAVNNVEEAVSLVIRSCIERGTLDQVFPDHATRRIITLRNLAPHIMRVLDDVTLFDKRDAPCWFCGGTRKHSRGCAWNNLKRAAEEMGVEIG